MTALDICNKALSLVDELPINGIDPHGNVVQRACWRTYHPVRRDILVGDRCTGFIWKFSICTVAIPDEVEDYSIPIDALRILDVQDKEANQKYWTMSGRTIFTTFGGGTVRYVTDAESDFPEEFVEIFAGVLAKALCPYLFGCKYDTYERKLDEYLAPLIEAQKEAIKGVPHGDRNGTLYPL